MTQTPNTTPTALDELHARIPAQHVLMDEIAASEKAYAIAHRSKPSVGGKLGATWDEQAAAFAKIVTAAEIALDRLANVRAKMATLADGQASR